MEKMDLLRKRLLYQSHHRGMKEMDLILGGFFQHFFHTLNEEELLHFEELLAFPDQDLYSWFFEEATVPDNVPRTLIKMINNYINHI